uniref:Uncharacterized protein n=1 Tax=Lygus hesperus TaxID=30085 RepID=A0A0A9Y5H5_LYGHE
MQQSHTNRIYQMHTTLELQEQCSQSRNSTTATAATTASTDGTTPNDISFDLQNLTNTYPVLEIYDTGTWKYYEDVLSGNLSGVYEMYRVKTVPSEQMLEFVYHSDNLAKVASSQCLNKYFYYIRLITSPSEGTPVNNSSSDTEEGEESTSDYTNANTQQVVGFVLGKQIVLGNLVMEMADDEMPWWLPPCIPKL